MLLVGAAVAVALGVYAKVHSPAGRPLFTCGFSGMLQMKAWLRRPDLPDLGSAHVVAGAAYCAVARRRGFRRRRAHRTVLSFFGAWPSKSTSAAAASATVRSA
ncbi:MAG: DUF6529 family protein [Mycobacteriales bacterium]